MGTDKALLAHSNATFYEEARRAILAVPFSIRCLVTNSKLSAQLPLEGFDSVLVNDADPSPQLDSLRLALGHLNTQAEKPDGSVVLLVDNPGDLVSRLTNLLAAAASSPSSVIAAGMAGEPGHPLWLPRRHWKGALDWSGEEGLRGYLRHVGEWPPRTCDCGPAALHDIDTPEDYRRLLKAQEPSC
jgi:CTP:molybdopterin cytidylyltransferase MocA